MDGMVMVDGDGGGDAGGMDEVLVVVNPLR